MPTKPILVVTLALALSVPAQAQHTHQHPPPQEPAPPAAEPPPAHEHGAQTTGHERMDHGAEGHEMPGMLGPYGISREASGTAWQPESAPHMGLHTTRGDWMLMTHGFLFLVYDDQGGPRGDEDVFSANMLMGMASREAGPGRLGLRAMISAEPWTIGRRGYPLLLQTGETADGVHPLVDRQHPHDLFMELAASYNVPVGEDGSVFVYAGWPGEPALGPPAFMHRFSGMDLPEAPLGHHWLDSTHVTFGVLTLGWIQGDVKLEGSVFTGREPDEDRLDIEEPKMDSWSVRASWQPTPDWSLQASYGFLKSPEQLEPEVDLDRVTASAIYNRPLPDGNWQTTFAWGRNAKDPGETTDTYLLESTLAFAPRHTVFGRAERQENDELFGHGDHGHEGEASDVVDSLEGRVFNVGKLTLGYIHDLFAGDGYQAGIGASWSLALVPEELEEVYGDQPSSWMAFVRVVLGSEM
ncbi:MAG TPA: hypothetical protein VEL74_21160 [Thermoanaerobaculia bacterium]|nr:hypothetical protein [Thermoanaerobaculia bacterium]